MPNVFSDYQNDDSLTFLTTLSQNFRIMKRKFFLHRQNAPFESDHVVYVVWAGESVREQCLLSRLMAWAFQAGATLRQWSEDVDFYLDLESDRVFGERGVLDFGFLRAEIPVSEAVIMADNDLWSNFESSIVMPRAYFQMVGAIDKSKLSSGRKAGGKSVHATPSRKNLSGRKMAARHIIKFI